LSSQGFGAKTGVNVVFLAKQKFCGEAGPGSPPPPPSREILGEEAADQAGGFGAKTGINVVFLEKFYGEDSAPAFPPGKFWGRKRHRATRFPVPVQKEKRGR